MCLQRGPSPTTGSDEGGDYSPYLKFLLVRKSACLRLTSFPAQAAGFLRNPDGERELVPMQFGLAKISAAEPFDRKWPNNNARIEKVDSLWLAT